MISTDYNDCPHCIVKTGKDAYDYECPGCDKCHGTGRRYIDARDLAIFESSREWMEEHTERVFDLWIKHIAEKDTRWSFEKATFNSNVAYITAKYYRGCSEYDYQEFEMPVKYLLAQNPAEFIEAEVAQRNADRKAQAAIKKEQEDNLRKIREQQEEAQRLLDIEAQERRDRDEWHRLQAKFGNKSS
jgi:hypothetical protein